MDTIPIMLGFYLLLEDNYWENINKLIILGKKKKMPVWYRMKVNLVQSCLAFCNPMGYTAHGILQAKVLEWVAFPLLYGIFPN